MKVESPNIFIEEIEGDTLTPISVYQMVSGKKKFLLESSHKHNDSGRFSFIGCDPVYELLSEKGETYLARKGVKERVEGPFSEVLKEMLPKLNTELDIPFIGGGVGFVSYDFIRDFEEIGPLKEDPLDMPEAQLMFFNEVIVFDHLKQKINLIGIPFPGYSNDDLIKKIKKRKKELDSPVKKQPVIRFSLSDFKASQNREEFEKSVRTAKSLIEEGEIFQVVLSRRLAADAKGDPFSFYRKLRVDNPSPYMYFIDFEDYVVAGTSPESLVKYREGTMIANPIAGTRPRGKTPDEDFRLESELKEDEKELAEHKMLVDLSRNDLGRICEVGSVKIEKFLAVERYQFVMHLVSEVSGRLLTVAHPMDGLAACLPAGTMSGAPKIRAMQIINELEAEKRGVYSGAVGYFSACGSMDFALAIRTLVVKDGKGYLQAGAGIVYDSDPAKEFDETNHKLKALMEAANDPTDR
ncbi:anthranilate synthase component I [Mesobacillus selenatarsenatis]|uniref:Anthranilate synthase component 1 n=1 Tax=Mesobacillus selenatarsenatis (strain DSM 18680 / JCM 14380 / FERM P-15431 / SF-1) TaxID=1321606 RepID=A0A0A8X7J8_MESS1|nr:anthranilate synthase component I [Mesobacillus selenatarsenatis]GAM15883.1 Anthranilate synthase, aminase component [Mesobacillus selenatarsenatis SF-1]